MAKKKILTDNGQEILPITHESCVLDNNGVSIGSKIGNINELATDSRTDLVSAINDILYFNNETKECIKEVLINNGIEIGEGESWESIIGKLNEEFAEKTNDLNEYENSKDRLYDLMLEGGYKVNSDMNLDDMLGLLELSGIYVNEIKQISCSSGHTLLLKNNGEVWACGAGTNGVLGLGDVASRTLFTKVTTNINNDVKQVACGRYHSIILKKDGSLWTCGQNSFGQLGLGTKDSNAHTTFQQVTTNINNDVKKIACGYGTHTVILKNDGSVWVCGDNQYGQLGLGVANTTVITTFTKVTTNINNDVKDVYCGFNYTFILKNDGSIWSCGGNAYGQLGLGNTTTKTTFTKVTTNVNNDVKQIACGDYHTIILKNDGSVWGTGVNSSGMLGLGNTSTINKFTKATTNVNNDVKYVACSGYSTHIIKNDGSLWCCGYSVNGELGIGSVSGNKNTFTQVTTNINNDVKEIYCGIFFNLIIKEDGSIWGCGLNTSGMLGLGTTTSINTYAQVPKGFSY